MGILIQSTSTSSPSRPRICRRPSTFPPGLEAVILKCLAKQADARYQTMAEVRANLEAFESGLTPNAVVEAVDRRSGTMADPTGAHAVMQVEVGGANPEGGSKLPIILGSLAGLVLVVGAAVTIYFTLLAPSEPVAEPAPPRPTPSWPSPRRWRSRRRRSPWLQPGAKRRRRRSPRSRRRHRRSSS